MEYKYSKIFKWTSGKPVQLIDGGIIPVYGSNGIIGFCNEAKYENRIILGRVGAYCGSVEYCNGSFNATDNTLITECNENLINYKYAYFMLQKAKLNEFAGGSAQPLITQSILKHLKVDLPSLSTQQKIADILSAYDELIENNNRQIEILEQEAEELYKEWFVRFRFPGHEATLFENGLPQGWEKSKLKHLIHYGGKSIDKNELSLDLVYLPIDCLPSKSMVLAQKDSLDNAESSLQLFKKGDILFGAMRPYFHKVIIAPQNGVTRKTCFVITPNSNMFLYYAYLLLFQETTVNYATTISVGSTMPYVRFDDFIRMDIVIPPKNVLEKFNVIIKPIMDKLLKYSNTNELLKQQRDLLLPRLMGGKLKVNTAEKVVVHDRFDAIREYWDGQKYDANNFGIAARSNGKISEETLQKLKDIAEEDD